MALEEPEDLQGFIKDQNGIPTYVDPPLEDYLDGMVVDYRTAIWGDGFVVMPRGPQEPSSPCQ